MNIITSLNNTNIVVNQLDENIKAAAEEAMLFVFNKYCSSNILMGKTYNLRYELYDIIKRNVEGNVNWKVG